ncbi:MAG: hypothetical protein ACR2FY_10530 [Pirellulaceae bacterium]
MKNDDEVRQQIHDMLKNVYFGDPDDMVDVSPGDGDCIHVVVVSRKFDRKRLKEKNELLWDLFEEHLPKKVWSRISLSVAKSPEEIKTGI